MEAITSAIDLKTRMRGSIVGLAVLVVVLTTMWLRSERKNQRCVTNFKYECPERLVDVWAQVSERSRRSGILPSNLISFAEMFRPRPSHFESHTYPLVCPGTESNLGAPKDVHQWMDYIFLDWSLWQADSITFGGDYPLMYDRALANHGGRGVYVLRVDGTVIWDPGAEWLKRFAVEHPQLKIRLPN